jgi:hypothetical protein
MISIGLSEANKIRVVGSEDDKGSSVRRSRTCKGAEEIKNHNESSDSERKAYKRR